MNIPQSSMSREFCEFCCENLACQRAKDVRCSQRTTVAASTTSTAPAPTTIETICDSSTIPVIEDDSDYGHAGVDKHQKYVVFCLICGIGSFLIGSLFLVIAFLFRSYTTTLEHFETVPSYAPSILLLFMGFLLIILANYRYRFSCLIKLCGTVCLLTAYICVQITVTTTLIHMNRLQTLQECAFTQSTRTCICYGPVPTPATTPPVPSPSVSSIKTALPTASSLADAAGTFYGDDDNETNEEFHIDSHDRLVPPLANSNRFVFEAVANCAIVHGSLYSCLRAAFGISVIAVLLCVFSFMLIYQLFSHEKKKRYLDELNARLNLFDQRQLNPVSFGSGGGGPNNYCNYCGEFRTTTATGVGQVAATPATSTSTATNVPATQQSFMQWDPNVPIDIFWNSRRVGNYYSPNPIERRTAALTAAAATTNTNSPNNNNPWRNWYRLPWLRSHISNTVSDCQYGFNETTETATVPDDNAANHDRPNTANSSESGSRTVCNHSWGPPPPYTNSPRRLCCSTAAAATTNPIFLPRLLHGVTTSGHNTASTPNTLIVSADCNHVPDNSETGASSTENAGDTGEEQSQGKACDEAEDYFADESSGSGYNETNSSKVGPESNDHQYEVIPETINNEPQPKRASSSALAASSSRTKRKHLRPKTVTAQDESDHTADSGWQSELYPSSGTAVTTTAPVTNQNISNSIHV